MPAADRTSVVAPRRCGPLGAGIPYRQHLGASSVPTPNMGLGRFRLKQEIHMTKLRLIAFAAVALAVATSAHGHVACAASSVGRHDHASPSAIVARG